MAGTAVRTGPKAAPAARRKGKAAAAKPTVIGRVFARPGVIVAGATFAAVMTGIVANALLFQKGHHPSPLFGAAQAEKAAAVPASLLAPPTVAPAPVQRPVAPEPAETAADTPVPAPEVARVAAPATAPRKPAHPAAKPIHKPAPAAHHDPIGDLLNKQAR